MKMKWMMALILVPSFASAAKIPMGIFEEAKLETLLRNIPASVVKTESFEGFVRKHHQFPLNKGHDFEIKCQADYYNEATIPSDKRCQVTISDKVLASDEFVSTITDETEVKALYNSMSYGNVVKSMYSHEKVGGYSAAGTYHQIFRFSFVCKTDSCRVVFATKPVVE